MCRAGRQWWPKECRAGCCALRTRGWFPGQSVPRSTAHSRCIQCRARQRASLRSAPISSTYRPRCNTQASEGVPMLSEFKNEPLTDFTKPANKKAMEAALKKVAGEFGREYPLVIGGQRITGLKTFDSINPAHKDQLLGTFQKGTKAHVEQAIEAAWKAFESWKKQPVDVRAGVLLKAAKLMRERKHE